MTSTPITDERLAKIETRAKYPCVTHLVSGCETNNAIIQDAVILIAEIRRLRIESAAFHAEMERVQKAVEEVGKKNINLVFEYAQFREAAHHKEMALHNELYELRKAAGILSPSEEMRNHIEGKPSVWDKGGTYNV